MNDEEREDMDEEIYTKYIKKQKTRDKKYDKAALLYDKDVLYDVSDNMINSDFGFYGLGESILNSIVSEVINSLDIWIIFQLDEDDKDELGKLVINFIETRIGSSLL